MVLKSNILPILPLHLRLIFEKLLQFKLPLNESNIFSPAIATNIFLKKKIFQEYHYLQINFYKKILLIL